MTYSGYAVETGAVLCDRLGSPKSPFLCSKPMLQFFRRFQVLVGQREIEIVFEHLAGDGWIANARHEKVWKPTPSTHPDRCWIRSWRPE